MFTERAKLILILFGVCLTIAWYTQFAFVYFICAVLASIFLISFLFFCFTLVNIECTRQCPHATYEDEAIKVKISIENRSVFSNYFVYLTDKFPADAPNKIVKKILFAHLPRRTIVNWSYEGLGYKRGVYWIGPITLEGSDPLGLFKKYKFVHISHRLTVYPRIFNILYMPPFMKGIVTPRYGPRTSRRSGDYEEFYGIREYRQEDGLRKIHWPSSAKHNQLIVRHFEQSGVHAVTISLDLKQDNNLGYGKDTTLEYAVKIAASMSKYFLDQGSIVQLLAYGEKALMSSLGRDPSHFLTIFELLAQVDSNSVYSLGEALTMLSPFIPHTSTLIAIRLDNDMETAKACEQLIHTKNISLVEVQLISSTFDQYATDFPTYYVEAKSQDIQTYKIACRDNLVAKFSQA